ncbi:hypothetical protein CKAH01_00472 [Colletotrichum kahawae]|uniref:Uncharacterized protein n=1 Tax=Colletotrichum kahawae TaxID=34407 RepID=A0AAD9YXN6_COLKA|nr:hypothetical protein CKAH01_00472 [Colletotrichum kahawae]
MGSASSREIRQIVDEAVVALQSEQARSSSMMGPVMDEDGVVYEEGGGGGGYRYDLDSSSDSESESETDLEEDGEGGCSECGDCCSDWESECCYETMDCCAGVGGGGGGGGCSVGRGCGFGGCSGRKDLKRRKGKKQKKKKKGFWGKCYPVMKRGGGEWGGDVVGFSRCPGERVTMQQDPKRWGYKVDDDAHRHASDGRKHVCIGSRSYAAATTRSKSRDTRHRRSKSRDRSRRRGGRDECDAHQSRRGRQRTLIFRESEDYPRREKSVPAYRHVTPTRYGPSRSGGGRYREGRQTRDVDYRRGAMMRGALVDDDGSYYERRPQYSRAGSYERRSDQDDELIGEIDDRSDHSYAYGEHHEMAVSRRDDGNRKNVHFDKRRPRPT